MPPNKHAVYESRPTHASPPIAPHDERQQEAATRAAALVDRLRLALPAPLRIDRNHGSESLEVRFCMLLGPPTSPTYTRTVRLHTFSVLNVVNMYASDG